MNPLTRRILELTVRLFARLERPERQWLLARLESDHRSMLQR